MKKPEIVSKVIINRRGIKEYKIVGGWGRDRLNSEDGPAVIHPSGKVEFWIDGMLFGYKYPNGMGTFIKEEETISCWPNGRVMYGYDGDMIWPVL